MNERAAGIGSSWLLEVQMRCGVKIILIFFVRANQSQQVIEKE
jgi:hypothetical protein